jgi:hypothetical protein
MMYIFCRNNLPQIKKKPNFSRRSNFTRQLTLLTENGLKTTALKVQEDKGFLLLHKKIMLTIIWQD